MKFLIVDDHPIMRLGARQLLLQAWPDAEVVEAETLADAVLRFQAAPPHLVLLDLAMSDTDGIEAAVRMLRVARGVPILVFSGNNEATHAGRLLQLGVRGFLPKSLAGTELVGAVRRVLDGGRYVTPAQAELLLGLLDGHAPSALPHESLSPQELRIVQLIAAGRTPAEIAAGLHLSVKTVGSYRARILQKTGWTSTAQLAKYCLQHGLTHAD